MRQIYFTQPRVYDKIQNAYSRFIINKAVLSVSNLNIVFYN